VIALLDKYYPGNQLRVNEMGWGCGTCGGGVKRNVCGILEVKYACKRPL